MPGALVPLVVLPRYTTLASGEFDFVTTPIDVTPYSRAIVTTWRGVILGTAPSGMDPPLPIEMRIEDSSDQTTWFPLNDLLHWDPGEDTQMQVSLELRPRRWLRMRVVLYADDNVVSCWAVGYLEKRLM